MNVETACSNSVGIQSHPVKAGHQPEASFASSPEMAARSVNSQCRSRVIEPRNKSVVGVFVVRMAGTASERREEPGAEIRPGSKSMARAQGSCLGTWEPRPRPRTPMPEGMRPAQQHPGLAGEDFPSRGERNREIQPRYSAQRHKRSAGKARGSLSGLIVPIESRRTGPPEAGE